MSSRRLLLVCGAALATCAVALSSTPVASSATGKRPTDRTVYLERIDAQNVDLGEPGSSVGDLRVTRGIVRATQDGKRIGTYATSQVTVASGLIGGTEQRSVIMEITIGKNEVTMTSLYVVPAGAAPIEKVVHPIVGGTGRYLGAKGSLTLVPLDAVSYRATLNFV